MRSQTYVDFFLGDVMVKAAGRARTLTGGDTDRPAVLVEDHAPGHDGDTDVYLNKHKQANAKGWVQRRQLSDAKSVLPQSIIYL